MLRLDELLPDRRKRQRAFDSRKQQRRRIASEQIKELISLARTEFISDRAAAQKHACLAWKLSTRFNVRLQDKRLFFCHKCKEFIVPPYTIRIRLSRRRKGINITCLRCGSTYRQII